MTHASRSISLIKDKLDEVKRPLKGVTPLYLAMSKALADFDTIRAESSRHLLVITDGKDSGASGYKQLIDAIRKRGNVQVDIVAFKLKETTDLRNIKEKLSVDSRSAKFEIHEAADGNLASILESLLVPPKFQVVPVAGGDTAPRKSLGETITLKSMPTSREEFGVVVSGVKSSPEPKRISLEGGEALTMKYSRQRNVLRHVWVVPQTTLEELGQDVLHSHAAPLQPERQGSDVRFPIWIRSVNSNKFSSRPQQVWVEITPLRQVDGRRQAMPKKIYRFYDPVFRDGTATPILESRAAAWPREATHATIKLWFKMARSPQNLQKLALNGRQQRAKNEPLRGRVTFDTETTVTTDRRFRLVRVTEKYSDGVDLFTAVITSQPPPMHATREYYHADRKVVHVLRYSGDVIGPSLWVTNKNAITTDAAAVEWPEIRLPERILP